MHGECDGIASRANRSIKHIDFVVGSGDVEIAGITTEGSKEPLIRDGEWAFDV